MKLYLVRHAEAADKAADPNRPLTPAGVRETELLRQLLLRFDLKLDAIWHSPKARSAQTAGILLPCTACKRGLVQRKNIKPMSKTEHVIPELLQARGDLMIVGHLPHLAELAARLLKWTKAARRIDWGKPSVLVLEKTKGTRWTLLWMAGPETVHTILKKRKQTPQLKRR
ncbi:MAG: phosphohistidine phosphatase SixA [Tepidisphaeraceae bacterium]